MKQSNNAIKFLMAQYRAVFKRAFLSNLGLAIAVTAGLTAGTVQAEATNLNDLNQVKSDVVVSGSDATSGYKFLQLSDGGSLNHKLTLEGYGNLTSTNENFIKAESDSGGANVSIDGSGSLVLNLRESKNTASSLAVLASGSGAAAKVSIDIGSIEIQRGDLQIGTGTSGHATVTADKIVVGDGKLNPEGNKADGDYSYIYLGVDKYNVDGSNITLGDSASKIDINSDGRIAFTYTSGNKTINADTLSVNGGYLFSQDQVGETTITDNSNTISVHKLDINNTGKLKVGSGSSIILTLNEKTANSKTESGAFTIDDKSSLEVNGTLTLNKGVTTIAKDAKVYTTASTSGAIVVGSGTNTTELQMDSSTLEGFLTGSINGTKVNDKAVDKGMVHVSGSGTLTFTDSAQVDLSDFGFSGSAAANKIQITSGATIKGNDLTVSSKLDASGLDINADSLTLGGGEKDNTGDLGFSSATTKNITFKDSSNATEFTLSNNVTLTSTTGEEDNLQASTGSINGDVKVSGSGVLKVDGGYYTYSDTMTLASGSLVVGGDNATDNGLTFTDGKLILDNSNSKNNNITIQAKTGKKAVLDLLDGGVSFLNETTGSSLSTFTVSGSGSLLQANASDIQALLDNGSDASGAAFVMSGGGTIELAGKLDLDSADIQTANASGGTITFSGDGNTLQVGELHFKDSTTNLKIGDNNTIKVDTLGLKATNTDSTFTFEQGKMEVLNGVINDGNVTTLSVSGGKVSFGASNKDSTGAIGGGSVGIDNLKVSSGSVEFNGSWITKNLESGISNGIQVSKVGNVTADRLTASVSGSVSVEDGGYLTVNGITNNDTNSDSGLSLTAEDAITLGGNMTLGAGVAEDIKVSGDTVTADFITEGAFDIKGGTLQINFDKSVQFSDKALGELKKKLFGNYGTINGVLHIGDAGLADLDLGKKDEDGRYDFSNVANSSDVTGNNVTNNELTNNAFTTTDGKNIGGTVGAIHVTNGTTATIDNTAGFVNSSTNGGFFVSAKGADGKDIAADINFNGTKLNLENGGEAGKITLNGSSTLNIRAQGDDQVATLTGISGTGANLNIAGTTVVKGAVDVDTAEVSKNLTVEDKATFGSLKSDAEGVGSLNVTKDLTVKSSADFTGDISVSGTASFGAETYLAGNNNFQNVNFKGSAELDKGVTTAKEITLDANSTNAKLELFGGASLNAKLIQTKGSKDMQILVGNQEGIDVDGSSYPATAGYLTADRVDLTQGSILIADPDYGSASSVVAINTLGKSSDASKDTAGVVRGQVVAARNSIIALGVADIADGDKAIDQVKSTFAKYFDGNGSLDADGVGAVLYVAKAVTVANNAKIVVDSTVGTTDYLKVDGKQSKITSDAYIGSNSVLAIDEVASGNQKQAAIQFESSDASLFAETGAKIVLTGSQISNANNLFNDANDDGIKVTTEDGEDLIVESLNGLYHGSIANGDTVKGTTNLSFNTKAARNMYAGRVSNSTAHTLIAYGANDLDWENANKAGHIEQFIHNGVNPDVTYDGSNFKDSTGKILDPKMFELVDHGNGKYTVYNARGNSFLLDDSAHHDGTSTEAATRLGSYGGAVHAAMQAGASTYNAISGHMGIGGSQFEITSASNSQGSSLWVSPIYSSLDSDGFSTGGLTYGADVDIYGLALGGDYTMSNGLRFGAVFNVGAGDADGNGGGAGISNDFNYYGFGIYGGYSMNNFSVLADLSYTVVDNDVDANTVLDKLSTSFDTTALSLGVTGQYALDLGNQFVVTPHAGLRFTRLDMDDYTIKGASYGEIGKFDGDSINVFSVPVGVTFAKEFQGEEWTVKPSFDLTLTGNFGDDEIEGLVKWNEVQNLTTAATAEVLDSFTYGATVGVSATSGNFSIGAGLNYTGSSNTDEFGINATARFLF